MLETETKDTKTRGCTVMLPCGLSKVYVVLTEATWIYIISNVYVIFKYRNLQFKTIYSVNVWLTQTFTPSCMNNDKHQTAKKIKHALDVHICKHTVN